MKPGELVHSQVGSGEVIADWRLPIADLRLA
jgi:hypothetical protein